jgi:hypothetical protein
MALSVFPLSLSLFLVQVQLHGLAALEALGRWGSGVGGLVLYAFSLYAFSLR